MGDVDVQPADAVASANDAAQESAAAHGLHENASRRCAL